MHSVLVSNGRPHVLLRGVRVVRGEGVRVGRGAGVRGEGVCVCVCVSL